MNIKKQVNAPKSVEGTTPKKQNVAGGTNNTEVKQAIKNIDNNKAMFTKAELDDMKSDTATGSNGGIDTISINNKDSFNTVRRSAGSKQVRHLMRIIAQECSKSATGIITYQAFCDAWEDEDKCGYKQTVPECFTHYWNGSSGATKNLVRTTSKHNLDLTTLNDALSFNR
tara:strand:+ start:31 stop:540 length:510 start_codon:yes stop_codon:yes gene_type:complete